MPGGDIRYFDRFAPLYDLLMPPARGGDLRRGLDTAERSVERVADVGGGTGRAIRSIDAREGLVLDASRPMLRRVAADTGRLQASATILPLRPECLDGILIVDALHHMADAPTVVREASRVIRPGGVLVVGEFNGATLRGRALAIGERLIGFDSVFRSVDAIVELLEDVGLKPTVVDDGFSCVVAGVKPRVP